MSGDTAEAATLIATLRDGPSLDLLLRLQRGKPRTIEQIRELAPPGINLGATLTTLERTGLIRVDRHGLRIEAPEPIVARAVADALESMRRRLASWGDTFAGMDARSDLAPHRPQSERVAQARPTEDTVTLHLIAGDAGGLWDDVFDGEETRALFALPDIAPVQGQLAALIAGDDRGPDPARSSLLVGARSLTEPRRRMLLDALLSAGAQISVAGTVPLWLALAPSRRATISSDAGHLPVSGLLSTTSPPLVDALHAAFDSWCATALRYPLTGTVVDDALPLRGQGLNDEEAAGALGVSARTLQRDLAQFMEEVGVRSRFELGAWWARNRVPSASADTACDDTVTREGTR